MSSTLKRVKKINTTLKIFLICFAVYFICNTYSK